MRHTTGQPGRNATAAALASIPAAVVNLVADARVTRIAVGRGGAWIGSSVRTFDPPIRVEEAVALVAPNLNGLRHVCLELTSGACIWFDASFRFRSFEDRARVAARHARLRAEHAQELEPHVRKKK